MKTNIHLAVFAIFLVSGCHCFRWTSGPEDASHVYACAGSQLLLAWDYETEAEGQVVSVEWFYDTPAEQLIAVSLQGNFNALNPFGNRLTHIKKAGLALSHVTLIDTGNYSVEVEVHDGAGQFFTHRRSVFVNVVLQGHLMTLDGQLHAQLEPGAIYSNNSNTLFVTLSCGEFRYQGHPPFMLEWVTPDGQSLPSTGYQNGKFLLNVDKPGTYSCQIPQAAAAEACQNPSTVLPKASVQLTAVDLRLGKLEARQDEMVKENEQLKVQNERLENEVSELRNQDVVLRQLMENVVQKTQGLDAGAAQRPVAFHAWLDVPHQSQGQLIFRHVVTNTDGVYNATSGRFTAPYAGLYYFAFTSGPEHTFHDYPDAAIKKSDNEMVCYCSSWLHEDVVSCQGVTHLDHNDQVFVFSNNHLRSMATAFTGFLIAADV